jgi:phosphatidylinositol-3-phosphatase
MQTERRPDLTMTATMRRSVVAGGLAMLLSLLGAAGSGAARDQRSRPHARGQQHVHRQPTARHRHKIQHVVWLLMENKNYSSVVNPGSATYLDHLAHRYGVATNYSALSHPSLPNYIALTSGSDQGISDDSDPSSHRLNVPSIFSQLPGDASRSLEQGMPSNCARGDSGEYAVRHNPETYYTNLGQECGRYDVPSGAKPDLSARFTFVTPNLINDMHDGSIGDGDRFLRSYVPALMATPQYRSRNTVIFITWDENDGSSDNRVPCIVISPFTHGVSDGTPYTHYSLLRTTESLLGLPLLGNARSANSMLGKFGF